jgi:hypothetical protein
MASRKRIKVVRGFRGTRHHGLAPGRKAKPIIKESCSRQRWDTVRDVSPAVKLRPRANDLIGIATRRDHGRGWP